MNAKSLRRMSIVVLAVVVGTGLWSVSAQGQEALPDDWQSLPAADFVEEVDKFYDHDNDSLVGNIDRVAVGEHAANLILEIDVPSAGTEIFPRASAHRWVT